MSKNNYVAEFEDQVGDLDFEISVTGPGLSEPLHYLIRPIDFLEYSGKIDLDGANVKDLQTGKSGSWHQMGPLSEKEELIFDAIRELFWTDKELQIKLRKILQSYIEGGKRGENPKPRDGESYVAGGNHMTASDAIGAQNSVNKLKNIKECNKMRRYMNIVEGLCADSGKTKKYDK